jgi:hypothetical protein
VSYNSTDSESGHRSDLKGVASGDFYETALWKVALDTGRVTRNPERERSRRPLCSTSVRIGDQPDGSTEHHRHYFFKTACQLSTTVIAGELPASPTLLIRNLVPSGLTS